MKIKIINKIVIYKIIKIASKFNQKSHLNNNSKIYLKVNTFKLLKNKTQN